MRRSILTYAVVLLSAFTLVSQEDARDKWLEAGRLYETGNFLSAAGVYSEIEAEGVQSAELYHNLGNCYTRLDSLAPAILYFEKSLKLDPSNADTRKNLAIVNERREEKILAVDSFYLNVWITGIAGWLSPMTWGILCVVGIWGLAYAVVRGVRLRTTDRLTVGLSVAVIMISLAFGSVSYVLRHRTSGGIVMQKTTCYVAPDPESLELRPVGSGEKVRIIDSLEGFYKVRFVNYEEGWIDMQVLQRI